MSPYTLTHIVYVVLVVAFVCIEGYMVWYNLRMKKREQELARQTAEPDSKEQAIMHAAFSFKRHFGQTHRTDR